VRPLTFRAALLGLPALLVLCLLVAGVSSVVGESLSPGLHHYVRFVTDPAYRAYLVRTLRVSFSVTVVTLLLGYPTAYVMARVGSLSRRLLMLALMVQFFAVNVTRIYALILILGNHGVVNRWLMAWGLVTSPIRLIYNELGVAIGLVSAALPFAVFPIYSVLGRMSPSLSEAARTLGADRMLIFWRITFPLTLPAVAASVTLVFLSSLGAFASPILLGGGFVDFIAVFSYDQAINLANYGFAAAGAVVTLGSAFVLVYLFNVVMDRMARLE
jgi:putative spermidine/putrescine transport system permease protein